MNIILFLTRKRLLVFDDAKTPGKHFQWDVLRVQVLCDIVIPKVILTLREDKALADSTI